MASTPEVGKSQKKEKKNTITVTIFYFVEFKKPAYVTDRGFDRSYRDDRDRQYRNGIYSTCGNPKKFINNIFYESDTAISAENVQYLHCLLKKII